MQRLKRETTSTELVEWLIYLDQEEEQKLKTREKYEWYLALIRMSLAIANGIDPRQFKLDDFFVDLEMKPIDADKKVTGVALSEAAKKKQQMDMINMKYLLGAAMGADVSILFDEDGKPKT